MWVAIEKEMNDLPRLIYVEPGVPTISRIGKLGRDNWIRNDLLQLCWFQLQVVPRN